MNALSIYGKVVSEPQLTTDAKKRRVLDFTVAVTRPSKRQGGSGADFVPVQVRGALIDEVRHVEYGDRVLISGRLRVERDGSCSLSAHDVWLPDYEEDTHGGRPVKKEA